MGVDTLTVLADRGYFSGPEVLACEKAGILSYNIKRAITLRGVPGLIAAMHS